MRDIEGALQKIYTKILGSPPNLSDSAERGLVDQFGIDSIVALELVTRVEEEFDIVVDDDDISLELVDSFETLAAYVRVKLT